MPNTKSAAKQARAALRRQKHNRLVHTSVKMVEKKIRSLVAGGKSDEASKLYTGFQAKIDKAAKKGIFHRNKANRQKSRLAALLKPKKA